MKSIKNLTESLGKTGQKIRPYKNLLNFENIVENLWKDNLNFRYLTNNLLLKHSLYLQFKNKKKLDNLTKVCTNYILEKKNKTITIKKKLY